MLTPSPARVIIPPINHTAITAMTPTLELDLTGLKCPLPILRAKKALATLETGQILSVRATDPGAPDDFAAFCCQTGHQLLASDTDNGVFVLVIQHK